jgi:hypothetical protein
MQNQQPLQLKREGKSTRVMNIPKMCRSAEPDSNVRLESDVHPEKQAGGRIAAEAEIQTDPRDEHPRKALNPIR